MQELHVKILNQWFPDEDSLKEDLNEIITANLGGKVIAPAVGDFNQPFHDRLKRTIVNQWGLPFVTDFQTGYFSRYITEQWKHLGCNAQELNINEKNIARRGLDFIANQLDLSQFVERLNRHHHKDYRWAYQLCYGVGTISFYLFEPNAVIAVMTNDGNIFDEFNLPEKPNESYSAKVIFVGFNEKSADYYRLKLRLFEELARKDIYRIL